MNIFKSSVLLLVVLLCCSMTIHSVAENYGIDNLQDVVEKAEQGDADAQFFLGGMYYKGEGVPQDFREAVKWYNDAAEQGHDGAQFNLGIMYFDGQAVPQNTKNAVRWFRKAAEQGVANAQCILGWLYAHGEGVPQNSREAIKWYMKAAEQGVAEAQAYLGEMYADGSGMPQNKSEAAEWYRKAAEQGHADAQFILGKMFTFGEGVPQDFRKAVKWYNDAAEQGHDGAQFNLGALYAMGRGVLQNEVIAYALFSLAAIDGNSSAIEFRDSLAKDLTKLEIKQGLEIAAKLKIKIEHNESSKTTPFKQENTIEKPDILGSGSGFIITENGYIITCYHVIDGATKITAFADNKAYAAELIRTDKHNDIALLKIIGTFSALSFSPRNSVKMGHDVFTIGYPNPLLQGVNPKLTEGNVNALTGFQDDIRLYQISAPVQPGNSGGALLDENGDVVGVIVSILNAETAFKVSGSLPQNVNYALKSAYAQALVDTVPESVQMLQKPHSKKPFSDVVERVKKSVVMVVAYD